MKWISDSERTMVDHKKIEDAINYLITHNVSLLELLQYLKLIKCITPETYERLVNGIKDE